jgi:hypothetical protein
MFVDPTFEDATFEAHHNASVNEDGGSDPAFRHLIALRKLSSRCAPRNLNQEALAEHSRLP